MSSLCVFIGRMQPFHNAHLTTVLRALKTHDRVGIVFGSAQESRSLKNPWTVQEREFMVEMCLSPKERERVWFGAVHDYLGENAKWASEVEYTVLTHNHQIEHGITLTGFEKDASSFYLKLFPKWKFEPAAVYAPVNGEVLSATEIRDSYFRGDATARWSAHVPFHVAQWMQLFRLTSAFREMATGNPDYRRVLEERHLERAGSQRSLGYPNR